MKLFKTIFVMLVLGLASVAGPAAAQTQTLNVPGVADNNNYGVMFDITAANTVTITGFSLREIQTGGDFRVYGRSGTHVGNTQSSAGWTLLASGTMPSGGDVVFPSPMFLVIPAGQTGALYIASENGGRIGYRSGAGLGNVLASDANITLLEGTGKNALDFSEGEYQPRAYAGTVNYRLGNHAPVPVAVPTMTEWAMILFSLLLAGAAALMIQRRRLA